MFDVFITEIDLTNIVIDYPAIECNPLAVAFHVDLLHVGWELAERFAVGEHRPGLHNQHEDASKRSGRGLPEKGFTAQRTL